MNQVANTVILPVEEYAALSAKLAKAQLEVERIARQVPKGCVEKYNELLYAVARKWPNESRHETALRYIRQVEERANSGDSAMIAAGEVKP